MLIYGWCYKSIGNARYFMIRKTLLLAIIASVVIIKPINLQAKEPIEGKERLTLNDINEVDIDMIDEYEGIPVSIIDTLSESFGHALEELDHIEDTYEWYLAYKDIIEKYGALLEETPETIYDVYTDDQIYYIERMVETETHGCSFDAHVNVANVVFNRIEHEKFPDDPISVVTSGNQFVYGRTKISESVRLAVEYAFQFPDTTHGAIFFHSGAKTKTFNRKPLVHQDDAGHYFYG